MTPDEIVEKLLTMLQLYPHYRVDSRGPAGFIIDIIKDLRPDIAAEMGKGVEAGELIEKFFG